MNNPLRILITGAAGFIGSHLAEKLIDEGHAVVGVDNFDAFYSKEYKQQNLRKLLASPAFTFVNGDAGEQSVLDALPPVDVVVHLAAKAGVQPSLQAPLAYIDSNVKLTAALLEWMHRRNVRRFVFGSSSSVYGNSSQMPFREAQSVDQPISPYAFTKRSCELVNYTYHHLYNISVVNLRFFTVYGERQRPDLAIHKFVRNVFNNRPIQVYGNGDTARDYTYYADTVNGIAAAVRYVCGRDAVWDTFNLGNSTPVTLNHLIACIGDATGIQPQLEYRGKAVGDVDVTYADITHAKNVLGYNPSTGLREGIGRFVAWYKQELL